MPNNLPPNLPRLKAGWSWAKLGDVAEYINGRAFKPIEWESNGFPIIRIQNLNDETAEFNYSTKSFEKKYLVENGDLLFAWSASLGTYFWNRGKAWLNQHIFKVLPKKIISKRFLFYTLNFIIDQFYSKTHGSGMVHITKKKFEETEIPLPPLPEQKKIVEKIEELFSDLENGVAFLKKAKEQIKLYRQCVLASAFNGKLTAGHPELVSGSDGLPKGWKWVKNKDLLKYVTSGSRDWKKYYSNSGAKFIRTQDNNTNKLNLENTAYVKLPKKVEGKRSLVEMGDLLMTITGANVGKVAIVDTPINETYVSQSVALMKYHDKKITKYLWYYFQAPDFGKTFIEKLVYGMGRPVLSLENMREVEVLMCPYKEQELIISEIENRFSEADNLEKAIDDSLGKSEALRQSILKKAFEG